MSSPDLAVLQKAHLTPEQFESLNREDKEHCIHLLNEEVKLRQSRKLLDYEPMEKQHAFHTSAAITRSMCGGNRSGKTTCGGIEFLFHVTRQYPDWYPKDKRYNLPIKARIIAKDFMKGVGEVISPFLEEWLDPSLIERTQRNPMGIKIKYWLKNGSVFDILTHEQSTEQFEGWKGHVAWFDEPPPRDKYVATLRGLVDFNGRNWLTLTPLTQPWIYDDIYTKADGKSIFVVTTDIRDNKHLTEQAIAEFEKSLTHEEKEARIHGRFMHLTGLIYKEFTPDVHICEPPQVQPHWTRYMAIDPHERTPTAVMWVAVDPQGRHWIYDELWLRDMDIEQMAYAIQAQEGKLRASVRLIDPHADKDNVAAGGFNFRKELMRHGVFCQRANSDTMLGKARIRQVLTPRYSSVVKGMLPQLRVSRECTQTIFEFQHYIWDEHKRNKEEYAPKETVKKKNDHFMDCLRYIYNFGPRYIPPEEDEGEIVYEGEYAKHPTNQRAPGHGAYHNLIEGEAEL
jgi:phage terminase large subunit-like protein